MNAHKIADAIANSFAALSVAFTYGSIVLAILAVIGGFAWGRIVTARAEKEARDEAKLCANELIQKWLANEAPEIFRQHLENLHGPTINDGDDPAAADEIGKEAG